MVVVIGDAADLVRVRARACENRLYIVWCRTSGVVVIDAGGEVIVETPWPARGAGALRAGSLSVREAACKEFAWRTHLLADRRPRTYSF